MIDYNQLSDNKERQILDTKINSTLDEQVTQICDRIEPLLNITVRNKKIFISPAEKQLTEITGAKDNLSYKKRITILNEKDIYPKKFSSLDVSNGKSTGGFSISLETPPLLNLNAFVKMAIVLSSDGFLKCFFGDSSGSIPKYTEDAILLAIVNLKKVENSSPWGFAAPNKSDVEIIAGASLSGKPTEIPKPKIVEFGNLIPNGRFLNDYLNNGEYLSPQIIGTPNDTIEEINKREIDERGLIPSWTVFSKGHNSRFSVKVAYKGAQSSFFQNDPDRDKVFNLSFFDNPTKKTSEARTLLISDEIPFKDISSAKAVYISFNAATNLKGKKLSVCLRVNSYVNDYVGGQSLISSTNTLVENKINNCVVKLPIGDIFSINLSRQISTYQIVFNFASDVPGVTETPYLIPPEMVNPDYAAHSSKSCGIFGKDYDFTTKDSGQVGIIELTNIQLTVDVPPSHSFYGNSPSVDREKSSNINVNETRHNLVMNGHFDIYNRVGFNKEIGHNFAVGRNTYPVADRWYLLSDIQKPTMTGEIPFELSAKTMLRKEPYSFFNHSYCGYNSNRETGYLNILYRVNQYGAEATEFNAKKTETLRLCHPIDQNTVLNFANFCQVHLSFWVKASIEGFYTFSITSINKKYYSSFKYRIKKSDTWEFKVISFKIYPEMIEYDKTLYKHQIYMSSISLNEYPPQQVNGLLLQWHLMDGFDIKTHLFGQKLDGTLNGYSKADIDSPSKIKNKSQFSIKKVELSTNPPSTSIITRYASNILTEEDLCLKFYEKIYLGVLINEEQRVILRNTGESPSSNSGVVFIANHLPKIVPPSKAKLVLPELNTGILKHDIFSPEKTAQYAMKPGEYTQFDSNINQTLFNVKLISAYLNKHHGMIFSYSCNSSTEDDEGNMITNSYYEIDADFFRA